MPTMNTNPTTTNTARKYFMRSVSIMVFLPPLLLARILAVLSLLSDCKAITQLDVLGVLSVHPANDRKDPRRCIQSRVCRDSCRDDTVRGARNPAAVIVAYDQQDSGCALRRYHSRGPVGPGVGIPATSPCAQRRKDHNKTRPSDHRGFANTRIA